MGYKITKFRVERLIREKKEFEKKFEDLVHFMKSEKYKSLDEENRKLIYLQKEAIGFCIVVLISIIAKNQKQISN